MLSIANRPWGKPKSAVHLTLLLLFFLLPQATSKAQASVVVLVQSSTLLPYQEATEAAIATLQEGVKKEAAKQLLGFQLEHLILDESLGQEGWLRLIAGYQPNLLLAVGSQALRLCAGFTSVPVIYTMVPDPDAIIGARERAGGVSMVVPPRKSLQKLNRFFPHVKRIIIPFNPEYSGSFVAEARAAADLLRFELIELPIESARELETSLQGHGAEADALWMIADPRVVNNQTAKVFVRFAVNHRLLLLTFSEKYLKQGATFAVVADSRAMGEDAGRLALTVLQPAGTQPQLVEVSPRSFSVLQNKKLLAKMALLQPQPTTEP